MLDHPYSSLPDEAKTIKKFGKGEYVFRQCDTVRAIYFLLKGRVQLQRTLKCGFVVNIHQAQSQESFAEAALFFDVYHCDAVCVCEVCVIQISKQILLERMKSEPQFAIDHIEILSRQVQHYRQRLQIASINSAEERVYAAMNANLVSEKITDFAAFIGLSHEATYRALSQLVKQGRVIKIGRGKYILKDKLDNSSV